jgi:multidrug efflux pump subunit AcrB
MYQMKMTSEISLAIGMIALLAVVVIFAPLLAIWALNTLFPALAIPYTLQTWFASIVITGVFKTKITMKG